MAAAFLQLSRYGAAIVLAPAIGSLVGVPFGIALDILWGNEVTGGRWAFTTPNVILAVIQSAAMGVAAGWIAGRRGKLIAGLADFFPLNAVLLISLVLNRDLIGAMRTYTDSEPSLWVWIGLLPALLAGHYTVKYKYLGFGPLLLTLAAIMGMVAQIGAAAFHFYTCIIAYQVEGVGSSVFAFVFPVISEIYWFWKIWGMTGTLWNNYTLRLGLLLVWGFSALVLAAVGAYFAKRRERKQVGVDAVTLPRGALWSERPVIPPPADEEPGRPSGPANGA